MATRGLYGFRKNGEDKLTYNHCNSGPEHLGAYIAEFAMETSVEELNAIYDKLILIDRSSTPTLAQIEECQWWASLNVSTREMNNWICLLWLAQGDFTALKSNLRYMVDYQGFIKDSLFCEYAYIINLDDNVLEFWMGFQQEPQEGNRYGTEDIAGFYPCKLALVFPLGYFSGSVTSQMMDHVAHVGKFIPPVRQS